MPLTTVASMPQKFGQIAQPDLILRISAAALAPAFPFLAPVAACAITSTLNPLAATPPSAPTPWRNLLRLNSIVCPPYMLAAMLGETEIETFDLRQNWRCETFPQTTGRPTILSPSTRPDGAR